MPNLSQLEPLVVDRRTACTLLAISRNRFWELVKTGDLEAVGGAVGKTRITYASVKAFATKERTRHADASDRAARMRQAKAAKAAQRAAPAT
jgi:predicted site-specific integrase-resolvase